MLKSICLVLAVAGALWAEGAEPEILARVRSDEAKAIVKPLASGDYYYAEVESVEKAGVQPVYSVRVDSADHSFITNGFASRSVTRPAKGAHPRCARDGWSSDWSSAARQLQERRTPCRRPSSPSEIVRHGSSSRNWVSTGRSS